MTDHLVRKTTAYPPLQRQQVIDPDDEVKDFSELFKETADDMTCNDTYKVYELEGTPYISHSTSFSDLRDLPEPLIPVQDSSPQEETVKVYHTEDTPYNFSNASSISDLTGISGHQSLGDPTHSALTSPRPEQQPKLFAPSVTCGATKLSTVPEDIVETPLVYSRSSPLGSISDEECNQGGDETGSVCSDFSRREEESEAVSPSDLPASPGELEPPAKKFTKPAAPPVPPKPKGLLLKLQSRRSEGFVPPPTKFQDTPPALPAPTHALTQSVRDPEAENAETAVDNRSEDEDEEEEDDDLDVDNEFFNKCLELGLRARSSVAVPKNVRSDTKMQSISTPITSQHEKQAAQAIAEVKRNGNGNMSCTDSDSESADDEDEGSDYAFIRMYMERGLRLDTEKGEKSVEVRNSASPPPPPLPAKRKSVKSACTAEKAGAGIGTKPVPSPADSGGSSARSGSRVGAGNVPHRSPPAVPSPLFQSSEPDPRTATSPAFSSSSSSSRKPYLETDIDSIVNYEMFLKSINSAAGCGIHSNC